MSKFENVKSAKVGQRQETKKLTVEDAAKLIERNRARDMEMVTGIFKNLENPKQGTAFRLKLYPGQEFDEWEFHDGERYCIPRYVARHLNNSCFYKEYKPLEDKFGDAGMIAAAGDGKLKKHTMQIARKIYRYAFHSLEFMDDDPEMKPSNLAEVTVSP